jgi:hypothetical protein
MGSVGISWDVSIVHVQGGAPSSSWRLPTQKTAGYHPVAIENGLFVDDFPSYKTRFVADLPLLGLITKGYLEKKRKIIHILTGLISMLCNSRWRTCNSIKMIVGSDFVRDDLPN